MKLGIAWNWVSFNETGDQFTRFARFYLLELDIILGEGVSNHKICKDFIVRNLIWWRIWVAVKAQVRQMQKLQLKLLWQDQCKDQFMWSKLLGVWSILVSFCFFCILFSSWLLISLSVSKFRPNYFISYRVSDKVTCSPKQGLFDLETPEYNAHNKSWNAGTSNE
jgi:hypothetical protein